MFERIILEILILVKNNSFEGNLLIIISKLNGLITLIKKTEIFRINSLKTMIQLYAVYKRHILDSKIQTG